MQDERPPTERELMAVAEDLVLVDGYKVMVIGGFRLGVDEVQPLCALDFQGRLNHTEDRREVHLALTPATAMDLVASILTTFEGAVARG